MAKIYNKGGTEKCLILGIREIFTQPFVASRWTDLRVGFLLSVVGSADPGEDDTITGLAETIGTPPRPFLPFTDRFSLGIIDGQTGSNFLGYTNVFSGRIPGPTIGTTKLISSDAAIGTTNTNFWRVTNEMSDHADLRIFSNGIPSATNVDGSQLHLVQDTTGAGGYATLVAMRFQRDDSAGRSKIIRMNVKVTGTHNGDVLYTNSPSDTTLETYLEDFPATTQQLGPVELFHEPDTLWAYWPFTGSRLRIHAYGLLRANAG